MNNLLHVAEHCNVLAQLETYVEFMFPLYLGNTICRFKNIWCVSFYKHKILEWSKNWSGLIWGLARSLVKLLLLWNCLCYSCVGLSWYPSEMQYLELQFAVWCLFSSLSSDPLPTSTPSARLHWRTPACSHSWGNGCSKETKAAGKEDAHCCLSICHPLWARQQCR